MSFRFAIYNAFEFDVKETDLLLFYLHRDEINLSTLMKYILCKITKKIIRCLKKSVNKLRRKKGTEK